LLLCHDDPDLATEVLDRSPSPFEGDRLHNRHFWPRFAVVATASLRLMLKRE
jgi:hypothetical protein